MTTILRDDAFDFGLGLFETIRIQNKIPLLYLEHLNRLFTSMKQLNISNPDARQLFSPEQLFQEASCLPDGIYAMKLSVSAQNALLSVRPSPYCAAQYEVGFHLKTSGIRRNETSPLVFHKTMNYGDNIMEKRNLKTDSYYDEPLFFNTRGYLSEGATTNLFLVREGCIFTPALSCGLLPGIMRSFLMQHFPVTEAWICSDELSSFDELFVTNSLLGIMPVTGIDHRILPIGPVTRSCMTAFDEMIKKALLPG